MRRALYLIVVALAVQAWGCGDIDSKPSGPISTNNATTNNAANNVSTANNSTSNNVVTTVEFDLVWTPKEVLFPTPTTGQIYEATITFTNESDATIEFRSSGVEEFDDDGMSEFYFRDEDALPPSELGPRSSHRSRVVYEPKTPLEDYAIFDFEWIEGGLTRTGEIELRSD